MKTILYEPIYINPQAYFVFPQLAVLEPKTDNFVEEAIFTGELIVENLEANSRLLIFTIFKNTKQVDLSEFAGKHIRISQYTNDGVVVLGEWNLPSISNNIENIIETIILKENNNDQTRESEL